MTFHWYGLMIGIAIVTGLSIVEKLEPRINRVAPWVLICGIIGARMYHVIDLWGYYSQNLRQILAVWNGGLSIWGALIGGGIIVALYFRRETLSVMAQIVTALPLSQAIGRIGNAINGEFTAQVGILPWWKAEAILDVMLFFLLWQIRAKSPYVRVGVYLLGYGLIRLFLNPYRA